MDSRASGTRHGFVNLTICGVIDSNPALHLQTSSWAAVDEGNNHCPRYGNALLDAFADFGQYIVCLSQLCARDQARRIAANIAKLPEIVRGTRRIGSRSKIRKRQPSGVRLRRIGDNPDALGDSPRPAPFPTALVVVSEHQAPIVQIIFRRRLHYCRVEVGACLASCPTS